MGAEVYFWWMIVFTAPGGGGAPAIMPVPYQTKESCEWAAKEAWAQVKCVPQPAADVAEFSATWVPPADVCQVKP